MKAAIQSVYDQLQAGHEEPHGHFLDWAKREPSEFYKIASKLIPIQVGGDDEGAPILVRIERSIVDPQA
tara:strand:- start:14686 stop:14892 length:207 start_codon:yes stop_codon:yes gene_type:complete